MSTRVEMVRTVDSSENGSELSVLRKLKLCADLRRRKYSPYRSRIEQDIINYLEENEIGFNFKEGDYVDDHFLLIDFLIQDKVAIKVSRSYVELNGKYIQRYIKDMEYLLDEYETVVAVVEQGLADVLTKRFGEEITVIVDPYDSLQEETLICENICNVDYSHFLAFHEKACKNFHSHTSWNVGLIVRGLVKDDIIVDFGDVKRIVKEVIKDELDHRLIVNRKYVTEEIRNLVIIEYFTNNYHRLELPKNEVLIIDKEPTNENIVAYFSEMVLERMPSNVSEIGLFMTEGTNNGCICFVERKLAYLPELKEILARLKGEEND